MGLLIKPRCIGPGRARTQLSFYSLHTLVTYVLITAAACVHINLAGAHRTRRDNLEQHIFSIQTELFHRAEEEGSD